MTDTAINPFANPDLPSLADLLNMVTNDADLTSRRRAELASAIRKTAAWFGHALSDGRGEFGPPPGGQVAARLQVSERSVWRWISDKELIVHRHGRWTRVHVDELERFLKLARDA